MKRRPGRPSYLLHEQPCHCEACRFRVARLRAGLTQQEMASRLDKYERTIRRWESGRHPVGELYLLMAIRIAGATG
jgi:DNA-binding XRE family transcriptional regulator